MVKVAFFTNDLKTRCSFWSALQFVVYDVDAHGFNLSEVVPTEEERTDGRVEMLQNLALTLSIVLKLTSCSGKSGQWKIFLSNIKKS